MERWLGKVAVVTGASAGIGAAVVEDLVQSGMQVVGLARRDDRLKEMKNRLQEKSGAFYPLKTDITKESDVKAAFKWINEHLGGVHVLVNNAGIFIKSMTCDGDVDDWKKMYEVNVFAVGSCTREVLNLMKEHNIDDGHIININSVASHRIGEFQGNAPYSSSKHASRAVTEGTRRELAAQKSKLKVTSISPGLVKTEIFEVTNAFSAAEIEAKNTLLSEDIAQAVHYVLSTPPHVQVNELIIRPVGDGY